MTYGEALLYGAVQGIAEYLPISSSAHLILLPRFLGERSNGLAFDVFLHFGTLLATLIYFWKDWRAILATLPGAGGALKSLLPRQAQPLESGAPWGRVVDWKLIAIATVPALVAGALFHHWIEDALRGNQVLVITLIFGGIALFAVDHFRSQGRALADMSMKDALSIGLIQCLALIPGVSRSGSTMTGGRLLGLDRASAARFSFLISAPVTAAAVVFELRKWPELFEGSIGIGPLLAAGASSFVFGMLTIGGLLRLLRHVGFLSFALYRVALAIAICLILGV